MGDDRGPGGEGPDAAARAAGPGEPMRLTLFVDNGSPATAAAIESLGALVADRPDDVHLEVVDVHQHPERAERHRILATPTLIRELPPPVRRLIGDLSRQNEVCVALEIAADPPSAFPDA